MGIAARILNPTTKANADDEFDASLHSWSSNYQKAIPNKKVVAEDRQRWVRISLVDHDGVLGTCIAFIAKKDFANRTLGSVKRGDIFTASGCNGPMAERLGNIFTGDMNNRRFFT